MSSFSMSVKDEGMQKISKRS